MLQKFIPSAATHHAVLRVQWSPTYVSVDQRTNVVKRRPCVATKHLTAAARVATYDGPAEGSTLKCAAPLANFSPFFFFESVRTTCDVLLHPMACRTMHILLLFILVKLYLSMSIHHFHLGHACTRMR